MVGAVSFSQSYLFLQLPLQSLLKILSPTSVIFSSAFHPYLFIKSLESTSNVLSLHQPFSQFRLCQRTNKHGSLTRTDTVLISFFSLNKSKDNRFHNHWFLVASRLWRIYLQSEWKTIQSTFSLTLNLLPLVLYPTKTFKKTHISL